MKAKDSLDIQVNARIDVSKETAEACAKLLEIWLNAGIDRRMDMEKMANGDRLEQRLYLVGGDTWE